MHRLVRVGITYLPPPVTKTLTRTKSAKRNELNISWNGEVKGTLLEKVDVEEYEMQVGDEPARERRNINVSYERDHQIPSPAIVDSKKRGRA